LRVYDLGVNTVTARLLWPNE